MRDFRSETAHVRCWDQATQNVFEAQGEPVMDVALQNREEFLALCRFIEAQGIRTYLEIGIWTGRTVSALHRLFQFDRVAACDHGWAEQLGLSLSVAEGVDLLRADSDSDAFLEWRAGLGRMDLVLIDANHSYRAVRLDTEINLRFPVQFLAFHDIAGTGRHAAGVRRHWAELRQAGQGRFWEFIEPHLELGLDHTTMGIGVWEPPRPV